MRTPIVLAAALAFGACVTPVTREPRLPSGVVVVPVEEGRLFGGEVTYGVPVPPAVMEKVILDFKSQGEFRPMVVSAEPVTTSPDGGTVLFRFRGMAGIDPEATCNYTVRQSGKIWRLAFDMRNSSVSLWALKGSFVVKPAKKGTASLVRQRFLLSAIVMDRQKLLEDLAADARAFRKRAIEIAKE